MSQSADAIRSLLGKGSIYTVGTMLRLAGGLLVLPFLTRLLDPAEYGIVATAIVVQTIIAVLAATGLPSAIVRTYFVGASGHARAESLVLATVATATGVALIADLTGHWWSGIFSDLSYGGPLRIAVWSAVAIAGLEAVLSLLTSQQRPVAFVAVVGVMTLGAQGTGTAAAAIDATAVAYLYGFAAGSALALLIGLVVALSRRGMIEAPSRELLSTAFRIGLPVIPHSLALYVMAAGDRVVIENLEGFEEVGRFYLAYVVGSVGYFIVAGFNQAWAPVVYAAAEGVRWRILADTAATVVMMAALLGGAIALAAEPVLTLLAPAEYELGELAPVSALVAAIVVPISSYLAASHVLFWLGRTGALAIFTPFTAAVNIALNIVLIPEIGLTGAAIATLAAYTLQAVLVGLWSRRLARVPWDDQRLLLASVVCAALVALAILEPSGGGWTVLRLLESAVLLSAAAALGRSAAAGAKTDDDARP